MSRLTRKTVIQAKLETAYGTDPGGWGGSDAILISNPSVNLVQDEVSRDLLRPTLGASESLIRARRVEIAFDVEVAGSGTADAPPAWGKLLRACGFAETVVTGSHVEYTPISDGFESLALRYVVDGVTHLALGARGTATWTLDAYSRPIVRFEFTGLDGGSVAASASGSYAGWQTPNTVRPAANSSLLIGSSYVPASGTLSGGTAVNMREFRIDLNTTVNHILLLGSERAEITDRAVQGNLSVELAAGDEVAWLTDIRNIVLTSLGFQHGSQAGNIVRLFAPAVQRRTPSVVDYEGTVLLGTELTLLPQSGDDELTVVTA
ncbi:hypothetical protein LV82_02554 [Albidovulum inexpectatum]|uniref:Tail protein n=1 Tax=Albidovulum inexpectatum TaxID=196587 RepID=A0A2S5JE78_9RHOB|nr:phage tail tube protein [Albidovulum inexpectatum]PPB79763.1 hypothetical protein LV82_02554 [Albidovulum inexpectatum]